MIYKYLDLSTAYLTKEQGTGGLEADLFVYTYDFGFFVPVPSDYEELPANLKKILDYAISKGCELIRFDKDGEDAPHGVGFEKFDW